MVGGSRTVASPTWRQNKSFQDLAPLLDDCVSLDLDKPGQQACAVKAPGEGSAYHDLVHVAARPTPVSRRSSPLPVYKRPFLETAMKGCKGCEYDPDAGNEKRSLPPKFGRRSLDDGPAPPVVDPSVWTRRCFAPNPRRKLVRNPDVPLHEPRPASSTLTGVVSATQQLREEIVLLRASRNLAIAEVHELGAWYRREIEAVHELQTKLRALIIDFPGGCVARETGAAPSPPLPRTRNSFCYYVAKTARIVLTGLGLIVAIAAVVERCVPNVESLLTDQTQGELQYKDHSLTMWLVGLYCASMGSVVARTCWPGGN